MAAALGDAEAELNLARMYSTGHGVPRDDVEAAKWLRRAADRAASSQRRSSPPCISPAGAL